MGSSTACFARASYGGWMASVHSRGGLAIRIVRVTLAIGLAVISIATIVALMSTSRMAAQLVEANNITALRMLDGAVEERLDSAADVMDRASLLVAGTSSAEDARSSIGLLFSGSRGVFDQLTVAEYDGRVLMSFPQGMTTSQVRALPAFTRIAEGSTGFVSSSQAGDPAIWVVRTTVDQRGEPLIIVGAVDGSFISRALDRTVRDESLRVAMIVQDTHVLGCQGFGAVPDLRGAQWAPQQGGSGSVTFRGPDGRVYSGFYDDVASSSGLGWRAITAERLETGTLTLLRAVAPSILVLILGVGVAVAFSWTASSSLARPLRDLERTARHAASGAYVKTLPLSGDDEMSRVAEAFNEVALRLNALHDLSQLLASAAKLDQVLDGILAAVGHIVGPGAAAIYLLSDDGAYLHPARTRGSAFSHAGDVRVADGGWLAQALHSPSPVTITGAHEAIAREIPGLAGLTSGALAAPLIAGRETMGLVVILQHSNEGVTEAAREMVRTFSAQAAVAVQTSRLFEFESESRQRAELLRAVAEELAHTQEVEHALLVVEAIVAEYFGAVSCEIVASNPRLLGTPRLIHQGHDEAALELAGVAAAEGARWKLFGPDDHLATSLVDMSDSAALLAVPIALDTDHGGALLVRLRQHPDPSSLQVVPALGDEIALAMENAYFSARALARADNLETVFRISQAVASSLQLNVVLNRVLDVVQKILSADAVMLWSLDPARGRSGTAMVRGDVPAGLANMELVSGEDIPGQVFASKEPRIVQRLTSHMDGLAGRMAVQRMNTLMAVPLLARGNSIGVLMVLSAAKDAFGGEDLNMLQTFASQAALAIDTARMYGKEHHVASVLQKSLLPALPEFPEVEAGSVYLPAGHEVEIGGDYYDLFRGPNGAVWFAIADVCGKGIEAATKTSMIKYTLRALVAAGMGPADVMAEVNQMVAETGEPSDIVTLWVGRYEPAMGILTWADGGHPPVALRRGDGSLESLGTTGPLLGALAGVKYEECVTGFQPGDRVMMYTDGVTEARSRGVFFGDERAVLELTLGRSAQADAEALKDAVEAFVKQPLRDDVAILVVSVSSAMQTAEGEDETS